LEKRDGEYRATTHGHLYVLLEYSMYHLLKPGIVEQPPTQTDFVGLIQWGMRTTIVLAGLLGFVFLVVIGFQYMLTDNITNKSHLRKRIVEVLLGLILAIGSYAILSFINPDILTLDFLQTLAPADSK